MNCKKAVLPAAVTAAIFAASCGYFAHTDSDAEPPTGVWYEENFRNYSANPAPVFSSDGISFENDPIWSCSAAVNVDKKTPGNVFTHSPCIPAAPAHAFDLLFRFRFTAAPENGAFELILNPDSGKNDPVSISFTNKSAALSGDGIESVSGNYAVPMDNGQWRNAAFTVRAETAELFVTDNGEYKSVFQCRIPGNFRCSGFNFKGNPGTKFSLTDLIFRSPGPIVSKTWRDEFPAPPAPSDRSVLAPGSVKLDKLTLNHTAQHITFSAGTGKPVLRAKWNDGTVSAWTVSVEGVSHNPMENLPGFVKGKTVVLPDAALRLTGADKTTPSAFLHVRPLMQRYHSSYSTVPAYAKILANWDKLPKASQHPLTVSFRKMESGDTGVYLDGSFAFALAKGKAELESLEVENSGGVILPACAQTLTPADDERYTVIDLPLNPRPKAFRDASVSIPPGPRSVGGIPFNVTAPGTSSDVGICRAGQGEWGLEVDEYLARTPFDGFPSAIHYRLPALPYVKAWVLCAIDPDSAKDPVMTLRLAGYRANGCGNNMIADTTVSLAGKKTPANFIPVGSVQYNGSDLPLYLAEIPLNAGKILDLVSGNGTIDFEIFGKPWINFEQVDRTFKPDPDSTSAFQIFGVTLEKASVAMELIQEQPGNVFTEDEKEAKTTVRLTSRIPTKGYLKWTAYNESGTPVFTGKVDCNFTKSGEMKEIGIPFRSARGYYRMDIAWHDPMYRPVLLHRAAFAILPKDERKASYTESPFGTWWFGSSHGSEGSLAIAGPLLRKAGIRKVSWASSGLTQEQMNPYQFSTMGNVMFPLSFRDMDPATGKFRNFSVPDPKDPLKKIEISGEEHVKRLLAEAIAKTPNADHVMIWHESAPGSGIPEELLNLPLPAVPENLKNTGAFINEAVAIVHRNFPGMKVQIGNSSASIGAVAWPVRTGAKLENYDFIGIETPSQTIPPEKLQEVGLQGMMITRDLASHYGKKDLRVNGCFEFTYRCERDIGELQQAEWYVRDALISLANGMTRISPGIFIDCTNSYYNSLWGASGIVTRSPFCYPKPAYAAYAVLTSVMDQAKFIRQIPTGSTTVYALEFTRPGGLYVYAFWAARGDVQLDVQYKETAKAASSDLYGREQDASGRSARISAGTAPAYLTTDKQIETLALAARTFPRETARAELSNNEAPLDNAALVKLEPDLSMETKHHAFLPILKPSDFTMKQVTDPEKGACLEIALDLSKNQETSRYVTEYTTVRLNEPVLLKGKPSAVGVWVKGDSNWGEIRFELEDAKGEVFKNLTTDSWGCSVSDWPGNLAENFDGWSFVAIPLEETNLFPDHSPGPVMDQWVSEGGNKKFEYPVKLRAITVGINRTKPDLLDFKKSSGTIRLKNAGGLEVPADAKER